jgi:hypothetical protein
VRTDSKTDTPSQYIAVIGDLVASRRVPPLERGELQERLRCTFDDLRGRSPELRSPLTITLGDEFQAVYSSASGLFADTLEILAAIHPTRARFAIGLGRISTAINPALAIGMDGPAFYAARDAIADLKRSGGLFSIRWREPTPSALLADQSLRLLSHLVGKWNRTRLLTAAMTYRGHDAAHIATALGVSRKTVYKTIQAGAVATVVSLLTAIAALIDRQLAGVSLEAP